MIVMHKNGFLLFFRGHIFTWEYTMYLLYTLYFFRGILAHHNKLKRRFISRIL